MKLLGEMKRTGAAMGCPYLSNSDYMAQDRSYVWRRKTFAPTMLTINLNLMTRELIEQVGLLDDRFSGCFNDLDYLLRMQQAGHRAIIADAGNVVHMGKASTSTATDVRRQEDERRFVEKYPQFAGRDPSQNMRCAMVNGRCSRAFRKWSGNRKHWRLRRLLGQLDRFEPIFRSV